jgi:hypothetical protein
MRDRLSEKTLEAQQDVFRLAERDYDLTKKAISSRSGIGYDSVLDYASGKTAMPIVALLKLCDVIPDHLLSHLLDPVGRYIASNETRDGDLADLGREASRFTHDFVEAVSDGNVTPIERAKLIEGARKLNSAASNLVGGAAA